MKKTTRDQLVLAIQAQYGASPTIIGLEFGISRARVHQIITKYKK